MLHVLISSGLFLFTVTSALPSFDNQIQDSCVLSLTIPRDSIKNNCNTQDGLLRKMQSMESQFNRLRGQIQAMERRLPQILSQSSAYQDKVDYLEVSLAKEATNFGTMNKRIDNLESIVNSIDLIGHERSQVNRNPINQPDTILDPIRPYLASEIQKIKEDIMETILTQIMTKISEQSEEIGSSEEMDDTKRTAANSAVSTGNNNDVSNAIVNHTEELTIPVKHASLELLARSMKNLHAVNSTEHITANKTDNVSKSNNETEEQNAEKKSMATIRNLIESTAEILRDEMKETVLSIKESEMSLVVSNMSEVMSKVTDLENFYKKNNDDIKNLKLNQTIYMSKVKNNFNAIENNIERLERKIDGPINDIFAESRLQERFENMETNIQTTMMNRFSAITRPWEIRFEQQDHRINMSTTFVNIFRETLNKNFNNSKVKIRQLEANINRLQQNVTSLSRRSSNGNNNYELRLQDIETQIQETLNAQFFMETGFSKFKESSSRADRDIQNNIRDLDQKVRQLEIDLIATTNLARKTETLEVGQRKFMNDLQVFHDTLHNLKMKLTLENGEWLQHNFSYSIAKIDCHKEQFIKKNTLYGDVAKYVGVVLCSPAKYKIFLGNSLDGEFLDIADKDGHGEDHCEYVGADSETGVNVDKAFLFPGSINVYLRQRWGEKPNVGMLSPIYMIPAWYECGIQIP